MKFKVGDRIHIYTCIDQQPEKAKVTEIHKCGWLGVLLDGEATPSPSWWHPKQCRLLKKAQQRRRIWVPSDAITLNFLASNNLPGTTLQAWLASKPEGNGDSFIEFTEVRKKK